jgi:hypothetical protein
VAAVRQAWRQEATIPSKSKVQARFFEAVAHNPKFAKEAGVPQSVGREFASADERRGTKGLPERKAKKGK